MMERIAILALKTKQKIEYQEISNELSEITLNNEETLSNNLYNFFNKLTDEITDKLEENKITLEDLPLFKKDIDQVILDNYEDYKLILGEACLDQWHTSDTYTNNQLVVKEKEIILDTIENYDTLPDLPVVNETPISPDIVEDEPDFAFKKKILIDNLIKTTLDKWLKKDTVQSTLDKYVLTPLKLITEDAVRYITDTFGDSVINGVANTLNTPNLLFDVVPNESVLEYLENRVFVASSDTMARVGDNIYDIIRREAEIEGKHPYEVARTLREEFPDLNVVQSKRIARTEILRAENEAKWQRLNNNETVEYVQWSAKIDDSSREEHAEQDGMITFIGNTFPNGQRYPYDENSDPGDYINCRCDLEAFYPDLFYVPPPNADCWFEDEMILQDTIPMDKVEYETPT